MSKEEKKTYAPNLRDYQEQEPTINKSYSEKDYTKLPDPVRDPIVSNNIANQEFNYTYNEEDDIFDSDYLFDEE